MMPTGMRDFGTMPDGQTVHQIALENAEMSVKLLTLGACLQDLRLPGVDHGLTLGFPDLAPYLGDLFHVGTLMGPVANRIEGASALIDDTRYHFDRNFLARHTLHSGSAALHNKVWHVSDLTATSATLSIALPDGEGGFPGNRAITARFSLNHNALTLTLSATTDQPTLINLANHSYWTLGPDATFRGHILKIAADHYLPSDPETTLPLGPTTPVAGTRFDYRAGLMLEAGDEGLLDTNFCLAPGPRPLQDVAWLRSPDGIAMTMATTAPGLQVFDGHMLGGFGAQNLDRRPVQNYAGLALEAQFWPNAPNNPGCPSIVLRPADTWRQTTRWTFDRVTPGNISRKT